MSKMPNSPNFPQRNETSQSAVPHALRTTTERNFYDLSKRVLRIVASGCASVAIAAPVTSVGGYSHAS